MLGVTPGRWASTGVFPKLTQRALNTSSASVRPLNEVPGPRRLPLVGTLPDFLRRAYNLAQIDPLAIHESYYQDYGQIYRLSLPPFGDHVVVCDPREFLQIIQMEGKYPSGQSQVAWPFMEYHTRANNNTIKKIMLDGEPWHEYRHKLSKDIFAPAAAREYLPAVARAARLASANATDYSCHFDEFISRLAFDMFAALALGRFTQTTNKAVAETADLQFVDDAAQAFALAGQLLLEPHRKFMPGGTMQRYMRHMAAAQARGDVIVNKVVADMNANTLDEFGQASYIAKLARRGQLEQSEISETLNMFLMAGVDTTSYVTAWLFLNLAQYPEKQETLREELTRELDGADLDAESLSRLPYLKACIRESHRHTPPAPIASFRAAPQDLTLCNFSIPQGMFVLLNASAFQQDHKYLPDHDAYIPERWLPDQVAKRRDTDSEVVDHRLLSAPFGFGARTCIGARIALLEIQAATCRIIQDHRLELEPGQSWKLKQGLMLKADPFPRFKITPL